MAVLQAGKLKTAGSVDSILARHEQVIIATEQITEAMEYLSQLPQVQQIRPEKNQLILTLAEGFNSADLNRFLFSKGVVLSELSVRKKSLESQFLDIIKQSNQPPA